MNKKIDVVNHILYTTGKDGNVKKKKIKLKLTQNARDKEESKGKFMSHSGFNNPLEYRFTDWGWLGNMWLR